MVRRCALYLENGRIDIMEDLGITFRYSKESDKDGIESLVTQCFGKRKRAYDDLERRYYVAVNSLGEVIAMTGIIDEGLYNAPEIDWTCVRKDYRNKGLIVKMIGDILKECKSNIYCSCWRFPGKSINLRHAMMTLGFKPVLLERARWDSRYNCDCGNHCVGPKNEEGYCICYEDLYLWEHKE